MRESGLSFGARVKAAFRMVFSTAGAGYYTGRYGSSGVGYWPEHYYHGEGEDYERLVGAPWHNSIVSICLGWIADNLPQARLRVTRNPDADEPSEVKNHPLTKLIRRPNGYYSGKALWAATAISYCVSGDAYWIKARGTGGFGSPVELWYVPHWQILPQYESDGSSFISSYLYRPGSGKEFTLKRSDLVHFRFGIDPENPRLGWSRLKAVLREMLSDNEIATYTAAILRNLGMPGGIVSPGEPGAVLPPEEQDRLEATWASKFTKSNRGRVLVASRKLQVDFPAFSPEQMVIDRMGNRPEARVCGSLRIPPMVVNLNVGDAQRTYSNYGEARTAAWEECVMPIQGDFAETLDTDLLPDLGDADGEDVSWDYSKVRALQEDEDQRSTRATSQFAAGGITRAEYRTAIGQKPDKKEDEVYFVPRGGQLVPAEQAGATALTEQREQAQAQFEQQGPESQGDTGAAALPGQNGTNGNGGAGGSPPVRFRGSGLASKALKAEEGDVHFVTIGGHVIPIYDHADGPARRPAEAGPAPEESEPTPSQKSILAKQTSRLVGADVQRYSEEHCEPVLADGLKAQGVAAYSLRDNEPVDVIRATGGKITDGVELKVMTDNKNNKITVKADAAARKAAWQKENNADFHTVVFDDHQVFNARGAGLHNDAARAIYYRRGTGSFRVGGMYRCKDMAELRSMIEMPGKDLPSAARAPAAYEGVKSGGVLVAS